jgi:hypothetical protein
MERLVVERSQVLWHRLRVNNLAARLPAGSLATAAFAGLQDSAPRAALTALYARVEDVGCSDWEDSSLVQTWAPRGAVFVVPRSDLPVFALGIMPRDPEVRRAVKQLAAKARDSVHEPRVKGPDLDRFESFALPDEHWRRRPIWRLAYALGGVRVRWDARSTQLLPGPALRMDEEAARQELARRFLRSLGPAGPARFTRWAAVGEADAGATFDAIADELTEVQWPGGSGFLLAPDADPLAGAEPVAGVRFVAFGADPVLQPGEDLVASDPSHRRAALPPWASMGLVLLDGEIVAAWGRSQDLITILRLASLGRERRREIEAEALGMPIPGATTNVLWRERR